MKQMLDTVWQRRGVSWIWDNDAFSSLAKASEVFSLRQLIRASKKHDAVLGAIRSVLSLTR